MTFISWPLIQSNRIHKLHSQSLVKVYNWFCNASTSHLMTKFDYEWDHAQGHLSRNIDLPSTPLDGTCLRFLTKSIDSDIPNPPQRSCLPVVSPVQERQHPHTHPNAFPRRS